MANTDLQFKVVADTACGTLFYKLEPHNAASGGYLNGNKISLPNGPEWYDITFHLVDKDPSRQIEFDQVEPICAHIGSTCPASGSGINTDGQLTIDPIDKSDRKKLVVHNKNQDPPRQIGYILCFVDGRTGSPLPPFDPIMDNGGGGHTVNL